MANGGRRKKKEVKREKEQIRRDSRAGQQGMAKLRIRQLTSFLLQTLCMCVCSVRVSIFFLFFYLRLHRNLENGKRCDFQMFFSHIFSTSLIVSLASQFSLTFFQLSFTHLSLTIIIIIVILSSRYEFFSFSSWKKRKKIAIYR